MTDTAIAPELRSFVDQIDADFEKTLLNNAVVASCSAMAERNNLTEISALRLMVVTLSNLEQARRAADLRQLRERREVALGRLGSVVGRDQGDA